jgi:hypothetical protein
MTISTNDDGTKACSLGKFSRDDAGDWEDLSNEHYPKPLMEFSFKAYLSICLPFNFIFLPPILLAGPDAGTRDEQCDRGL